MSPEPKPETEPREVRLEGTALLIAGAALLAVLLGVFYLGVRVGRGSAQESDNGGGSSVGVAPLETPPPASASPGYFDRAEPGARETEREVKPASAPPASPVASPRTSPGTYFVQVFAGRDRRAAESLVQGLTEKGYPVRLDTQREGQDALYKVRVGGYPTQDDAKDAAERLKKEGQSGAWVTQVR